MAIESIITARLNITPAIAIRTMSFEKVRSDFMAIRPAMKYSKFNLINLWTQKCLNPF
ncbi:hypothetical protein GCM10008119_15650 [Pedobacter mendelii]|uniref:Uncharacterized protein n=1 Tax=Pedobacter mendelii TaxID=1908240 RepID=A0ABQ2BHD1_9SPHI|nr:hypothetical protein GCM10008119_15650 [Pedobacter mendelii]